jgi:hypothetical protein
MFESKRSARTAPDDIIRLGAVREKLVSLGYEPCSALAPHGLAAAGTDASPHVFTLPLPDFAASEHPAAVRAVGKAPLAILVLRPIDDAVLSQRVAKLLDEHRLTSGPCRTGSDGTRLFPLRCEYLILSSVALKGRVELRHAQRGGPVGEIVSEILPLDGAWSRSLLETPYNALQALSSALARELIDELDRLPYKLSEERRPPPKPSKFAFIGR